MGHVPRTFVVALTRAERTFMTVPVPSIDDQAPGDPRRAVDVLISETLFDPEADPDVPPPARLAVTVRDPVFAAVFGYLAGGNPAAALRVGGDLRNVALRMIAEKVENYRTPLQAPRTSCCVPNRIRARMTFRSNG